MKWLVTLALVGFGCPAVAQDLPYSDAATMRCLLESDDLRDCIGQSAQLCMNTPDGGTTVGMSGCLDREHTFWDTRLNDNYKTRRAEAKAIDAEMAELGATVTSQADALLAMQRAWIIYRDATCLWEYSKWGGGTGGGPAHVACMLQLTGEQALTLATPFQ